MARNQRRSEATSEIRLEPLRDLCEACGERMWVAYHGIRTVTTLEGAVRLRLVVRLFLYGLQNTSKQTSVSAPQLAARGTAIIARNGLVICRATTPLDTTLIPPGAQYGATPSNRENRNPFRNAAFAILCTPLQRLSDHS
jgi:hypothetical protein